MPFSDKQRRFAFLQLSKKKKGQKTSGFKGMSKDELEDYAHAPMEKKKSKKKGGRANPFAKRSAADQANAFEKRG